MVKSEGSESKFSLGMRLAGIPALCLLAIFAASPTKAAAQSSDFTLTTTSLDPQAIVPGGTSSSTITIQPANGFSGTVTLGCTVTANQSPVTDAPVCTVSPPSVTPPATATATLTSKADTTTVGYSVAITGTDPSGGTLSSPPLGLTVLAVTPQFTISVQTVMSPTSVPAGNSAQGTIVVTPVNGYMTPTGTPGAGVTLYCSSISPLVTIPPVCSFSYPQGATSLQVTTAPASSTLTIHAQGTTVVGSLKPSGRFYASWLPVPLLGLVGVGAAIGGKRSRKAFGVLALFVLGGSLLLLPGCVNNLSNGATATPNGITPANTYTFTIIGIDQDGVVSSNTGGKNGPTVSLTVTAPAAQ